MMLFENWSNNSRIKRRETKRWNKYTQFVENLIKSEDNDKYEMYRISNLIVVWTLFYEKDWHYLFYQHERLVMLHQHDQFIVLQQLISILQQHQQIIITNIVIKCLCLLQIMYPIFNLMSEYDATTIYLRSGAYSAQKVFCTKTGM